MSNLVEIKSGQVLTSSLNVAQTFGKEHKDVLKAIKNLNCSDEFTGRNFALSEYKDPTGRTLPMYLMTKDGFVFLVMGFSGKKAGKFKEDYIAAFNAMEKKLKEGNRSISEIVMHYVLPHSRKYDPIFPEEFFKEVYRLRNWDWSHYERTGTHPSPTHIIFDKWIYPYLPDGVYTQIKKLNKRSKSGNLTKKHHQYLKEGIGFQHFLSQMTLILGVMRLSYSWEHFEVLAADACRKQTEPRQSKLFVCS